MYSIGRTEYTVAWCSMDNWQLLINSEFCDGELSSVSKIEQVMVLYQACNKLLY